MPYSAIDPALLTVYPVETRASKTSIEKVAANPDEEPVPCTASETSVLDEVADRIVIARNRNASRILAFGAHLIKNGAGPMIDRLMSDGWLTHLATNGAGSIHDWEFAWLGRSEENVRENVKTGTFGTWQETGYYINLAVLVGAIHGMGYGESLGALIAHESLEIPDTGELEKLLHAAIASNDPRAGALLELLMSIHLHKVPTGKLSVPHPWKRYSVFGNAFRHRIPITVHPGIGYDIIYNHPFANGAAIGRGSHMDYRIFVNSMMGLSNGVFLSVGSAVMAPQIFEKALSFANNILLLQQRRIDGHFILVDDLQRSVWDWSQGEPPKSSPDYYLRFLKSFYRMGADVRYLAMDNCQLLHHLYWRLKQA